MIDADAFNAFEAAGWEEHASGYDDFFGSISTRVIDPLLDAAEVAAGSRVLDAASGPGYVAGRAAERGASVIGIDIAEAMLALARRAHPDLDFRHGDAEALAFADESFDAVVANFLVLHLGRPEQAAAEFARVLVPGGRVALTVWDVPERARFVGVFLDAVAAVGATPPADLPAGPPFFRFSDEAEFARLLTEQGLEQVECRTISFLHQVSSADDLWRGLLGGAVRTPALIFGQTDEVQQQIRAAFERLVEPFQVGNRLELPVAVSLASAEKPR